MLHANFLRSGRKKPYRSQGGNSKQVDWLGVFFQSNKPVTGGARHWGNRAFPEFDQGKRAEKEDVLDYPPEGSPDFKP